MKVHTNLTADDLAIALFTAKNKGHVAADVGFTVFHGFGPYKGRPNSHGSLTHDRAFEVQLGVSRSRPATLPKGTVNRHGAPQKNRHTANSGGSWAATWHEWGWFMAEVFKRDQHAMFGTVKYGYNGVDDFNEKTNYQFTEESE